MLLDGRSGSAGDFALCSRLASELAAAESLQDVPPLKEAPNPSARSQSPLVSHCPGPTRACIPSPSAGATLSRAHDVTIGLL